MITLFIQTKSENDDDDGRGVMSTTTAQCHALFS